MSIFRSLRNFKYMFVFYQQQMINIESPNSAELPPTHAHLPKNLQNSQNIPRTSKNKCLGSITIKTKTFPSQTICVKEADLGKEIQILEWRLKTQFPIVKVRSWKVLSAKTQNKSTDSNEIFVELQSHMKSLQDYEKMSFAHAIYVLKQALIGFERLYYHFGNFELSSSLIKFNETGQCKVWINKECFSSFFKKSNISSESDFISQICKTIKNRSSKSSTLKSFFEKVDGCKYFFEAIGVIDRFVKFNKISVPNCLQNLEDIKSPLLKGSLNINLAAKPSNLVNSNKIPAFLKRNQVKKKNSNESETPQPTKTLAEPQACIVDRTLTDVSRTLNIQSRQKFEVPDSIIQSNQKDSDEDKKAMEDILIGDLNIRIVEPTSAKKQTDEVMNQNASGCLSVMQNNPQNRFGRFGRVSDFDSSEDKNSAFSLNKMQSKEYINPLNIEEKMTLKIKKPHKTTGPLSSFSQGKAFFPKRLNTLHDFNAEQDGFQRAQIDSKKLSINIKQTRQKRKYSGDFQSFSSNKDENKNESPAKHTPNFLMASRNDRNKNSLSKSPSHQVISFSCKMIDSDQEIKNEQFLRQKIMAKHVLQVVNFQNEQRNKKQRQGRISYNEPSIKKFEPQSKQETHPKQSKNIGKLSTMGREIESKQTAKCEFEMQFGSKIQKQKSIRNQFMNLFD